MQTAGEINRGPTNVMRVRTRIDVVARLLFQGADARDEGRRICAMLSAVSTGLKDDRTCKEVSRKKMIADDPAAGLVERLARPSA